MCGISGIKNKLAPVLGAIACAGLLAGCSSGQTIHGELQELNQMELVETIGADQEKDQVLMSVSTNAATGEEGTGPTILQTRGNSVAEALEGMPAFTPKRFLFFGHTKHFVLGEAAAEQGLGPYMDYVERDMTMRLDTNLFVVKGGSAREIITGENDVSEMLDSVEASVRRESEGYVYNFNEIAQSLVQNGAALVAAVESVPAEEYQPGMEGEVIRFAGYAMVRDGKLAAYADRDCARGINLLTDQVEGGVLTVADGAGGYASLNLTRLNLSLEPQTEQGRLKGLTVHMDMEMNLEGLQNDVNVYDPAVLAALEDRAAEQEREKVEQALQLAQELETDFYGLGKRLELADKKLYKSLNGEWETLFPELELDTQIHVTVVRSYDIGGFVRTNDN